MIQADRGSTISGVTQIIAEKYYSRSQAEELSGYLKWAIAAYEARMYQFVARPAVPPDQPCKFLYAFEIEDIDIFFGRDAASERLHQTVLKDRLTVLHTKSGAGKTSLLNAGLSPRLIREGYLLVYARAYEDPVRAVKRAIAPPSLRPWSELLPRDNPERKALESMLGTRLDLESRARRWSETYRPGPRTEVVQGRLWEEDVDE